MWCDLWRLHCGNSFNALQFIGSDDALFNKLVNSQIQNQILSNYLNQSVIANDFSQWAGVSERQNAKTMQKTGRMLSVFTKDEQS